MEFFLQDKPIENSLDGQFRIFVVSSLHGSVHIWELHLKKQN